MDNNNNKNKKHVDNKILERERDIWHVKLTCSMFTLIRNVSKPSLP